MEVHVSDPGLACVVHRGDGFAYVHFRCPPGHESWGRERVLQNYVLSIPHVPVQFRMGGPRGFVATPNCVLAGNSGDTYVRWALSSRGQECDTFVVAPGIL